MDVQIVDLNSQFLWEEISSLYRARSQASLCLFLEYKPPQLSFRLLPHCKTHQITLFVSGHLFKCMQTEPFSVQLDFQQFYCACMHVRSGKESAVQLHFRQTMLQMSSSKQAAQGQTCFKQVILPYIDNRVGQIRLSASAQALYQLHFPKSSFFNLVAISMIERKARNCQLRLDQEDRCYILTISVPQLDIQIFTSEFRRLGGSSTQRRFTGRYSCGRLKNAIGLMRRGDKTSVGLRIEGNMVILKSFEQRLCIQTIMLQQTQ